MRRFLAYCWLAFFCGPALSAGEHERRLAAELVVLAGDIGRVVEVKLAPLERTGLERRIAGSLSSLPLLLRRAGHFSNYVTSLRAATEKNDWRALQTGVAILKRRNPFFPGRLFDLPATPANLALGASLHLSTCAACHDAPAPDDTLLPAKNLAAQIKSMPRDEFIARLWLGIRGDHLTSFANPFGDVALAALTAYYSEVR